MLGLQYECNISLMIFQQYISLQKLLGRLKPSIWYLCSAICRHQGGTAVGDLSKLKALSTCSAQLCLANIIIQKSSLPHLQRFQSSKEREPSSSSLQSKFMINLVNDVNVIIFDKMVMNMVVAESIVCCVFTQIPKVRMSE